VHPTVDLDDPSERTALYEFRVRDCSHASFSIRADFEQAEFFVNEGCSDERLGAQLEFQLLHGMVLQVKTARKVRELLARRAEQGA
jgi:hypothetical protein